MLTVQLLTAQGLLPGPLQLCWLQVCVGAALRGAAAQDVEHTQLQGASVTT